MPTSDTTTDRPDDDQPFELPIPPDYDERQDAAFREGWVACAQVFQSAAISYVNAVDADPAGPDASEGANEDEDDLPVCATCDGGLYASMGADESEHSPAGYCCPACDLAD